MPVSYVLINCKMGEEKEVLSLLKQLETVTESIIVTGAYDIVAKLESDSFERVQNAVAQIRKLERVHSTHTLATTELSPHLVNA